MSLCQLLVLISINAILIIIERNEGLTRRLDDMNEITIGDYIVRRRPSIYARRNNASVKLDDVCVWLTDGKNYGAYENGRYYNTVCVVKCESGREKRGHVSSLPEDVAEAVAGMID